jgi:hypothetical protein
MNDGFGDTGTSHHRVGTWSLVGTITTISLLVHFYRIHRQRKTILGFVRINKLMH